MEINNLLERIKGKEIGYNSVSCELIELDIDKKNHTIFHAISSEVKDRHGTIVHQDGIDRTNYSKNPMVLFNHGSHSGFFNPDPPPEEILKYTIGRSQSQRMKDGKLHAKTEFYTKKEFPLEVWEYTIDGFLPAWSIGFIPVEYAYEKEKGNDRDVLHYKLIELLEYSKVPIGSNPDAVKEMKKFAKTEEMIRSLDYYEKNELAETEVKNILKDATEFRKLFEELQAEQKAIKEQLKDFDIETLNKSIGDNHKLSMTATSELYKENEALLKEINLLKSKDLTKELNSKLKDITELITLRLEKKFKDVEIAGKGFVTEKRVMEIFAGAISSIFGKKLKY